MAPPLDQSDFAKRSLADRIDLVRGEFERAFHSGTNPRIEDFLVDLSDEDRLAAIPLLVAVEVGLLINFHELVLKDGIKRIVNDYREE